MKTHRTQKQYRVKSHGYTALGVGTDPASQKEADQYDTPAYGYVDLAVENLGIKTRTGTWTFSSQEDAESVADHIQSVDCADCNGVAVKFAEVTEEDVAPDPEAQSHTA